LGNNKKVLTEGLQFITQERDLFKKQFLKMQQNYETKIEELSIFKELGNVLRSSNFYDKKNFFLNQILKIKQYTFFDDIFFMLVDEELNSLEIIARTDAEDSFDQASFLPIQEETPGEAIIKKTSVIIDDHWLQTSGQKQLVNRKGLMLCVPVIHNNKAIGVLSFRNKKTSNFDQNQISFFSLIADQLATAVILFRLYDQMLREEKNRFLLSRFFSKDVTEKILGSTENIRLGGERKDVTILFADLHGFTTMSENLDQEEVVKILNEYFSLMTPIIFKYDGTLDKLMGDAILTFFGAPISHGNHSLRAVQTAIEMSIALKEFNEQVTGNNWPILQESIGINSGEVVAGYIGSEDHLNYTVIGDAVNIAQRLESIAGPNEILISKRVYKEIQHKIDEIEGLKALVPLPAQNVKGKEKAIEIYRVET